MTNTKTALVTGASKGLGYALAEYLAHNGWNLLINARNAKQLLEAKKHLEPFTKVIAGGSFANQSLAIRSCS